MTQPRQFQIWPRLGLRGWVTVIVALAITAAILVAVTALALGILLFLLPVLAIGALIFYLFPSMFYPAQRRRRDSTIIDGEFRVVDPGEDENGPKNGA
jgi:hypothetical protein